MNKEPKEIHENLIPRKIKQPYCTVLILIRITIKKQTYLITGQQVPS